MAYSIETFPSSSYKTASKFGGYMKFNQAGLKFNQIDMTFNGIYGPYPFSTENFPATTYTTE